MNTSSVRHFLRLYRHLTPTVTGATITPTRKLSATTFTATYAVRKTITQSSTLCCNPCYNQTNSSPWKVFLSAGLLSLLSPRDADEEDTPEGKLIMAIKRSILCIQRQQFDKAEQMLHLALRMAQDMQNKDGITFVYDVMANLAMETEHYKKAEKLFVTVMQRLLQDGYKEDDIKMLHISSKIAHMETLQGNFEKARQGFLWTLDMIERQTERLQNDADLLELLGLTKDCYAQLLMQLKHFVEAKENFAAALDIYTQIHGRINPEVVSLLNNLAVVCTNIDDLVGAEVYITEAVELAKQYPEMYDSGVFQANQGMLMIKQGLLDQAKKTCTTAWRLAKKVNNRDGIEQADYCLNELKKLKI